MAKTYEKMLKTAKLKPTELWGMIKLAAIKSVEIIVNVEKDNNTEEE